MNSEAIRRAAREVGLWLKTIGSAAVYATLIVTFVGQVARVEGYSMQPTLEDQDRLIVNKLAYRLSEPKAGDVVMLLSPEAPDLTLVKRVIAEPGDTIRSEDGRVFRNAEPLSDEFVAKEFRSHDTWGPQSVPPGFYFVMGDHRNGSSDSRVFSYVPRNYILGKVQVRWWPLTKARVF
jgi:signal peptidase I